LTSLFILTKGQGQSSQSEEELSNWWDGRPWHRKS